MICGEYDNLRDGGEKLVGRMREGGVEVEYRAFTYLSHWFFSKSRTFCWDLGSGVGDMRYFIR